MIPSEPRLSSKSRVTGRGVVVAPGLQVHSNLLDQAKPEPDSFSNVGAEGAESFRFAPAATHSSGMYRRRAGSVSFQIGSMAKMKRQAQTSLGSNEVRQSVPNQAYGCTTSMPRDPAMPREPASIRETSLAPPVSTSASFRILDGRED